MTDAFAYGAPFLLRGGYSAVPLRKGEKRPLHHAWDRLRTAPMPIQSVTALAHRCPGLGLGVAGGYNGLVPIDIDTEDPKVMQAVAAILPRPSVSKQGKRGLTLFYRTAQPITAQKFRKPNKEMLVEILTSGQSVIPPTIHPDTSAPYVWLTKRTLFDTALKDLVEITPHHIEMIAEALAPFLDRPVSASPSTLGPEVPKTSDKRLRAYALRVLQGEVRILSAMGKDTGRNWQLFRSAAKLGKYVHHGLLTPAEVEGPLLRTCQANGLLAEDGRKQCQDTISSGILKAQHDKLPELAPRKPQRTKGR